MRSMVLTVLALLLLSAPVTATYEQALTDYEITLALIAVAWERSETAGFDDISVQIVESEVLAGLDKMRSLVVSSCYDDWHMTVMTYLQMQIGALRNTREVDPVADAMIAALPGLRALEGELRLEATIACKIGD